MPQLDLNLKDFSFKDLLTAEGIKVFDGHFLSYLALTDSALCDQLLDYRQAEATKNTPSFSYFLLSIAKHMEYFLADVFNIVDESAQLQARTLAHTPIFSFKKYFVLKEARRASKKYNPSDDFYSINNLINRDLGDYFDVIPEDIELAIATYGLSLLDDASSHQSAIDRLVQWCVLAMLTEEGYALTSSWSMFKLPSKLNFENLVDAEPLPNDLHARLQAAETALRQREGFGLTDDRMSQREVMSEVNYCVYCHKNTGDYCSTGFLIKKNDPEQGYKISPTNDVLTGCPLEEKISEMNTLKKEGLSIAALAMVMRDNPMCAVTGHRICNDCMKACIYQRQEPVDIPQIETRVLTDVLGLPWGVELYHLLMQWNPLRQQQFILKPYNGGKVMVMGMGPAGFSLSHHLLMEGFAVFGVDGLKLEPIDRHLLEEPIISYEALKEALDHRVMRGFGGVAEYGITVRWDKNFLKLIYISLLRSHYFQLVGSTRFGGTLTIDDVWSLGFDHLALAVGAGLPKELSIPNSLAPGMRHATDFLMALQLTGAAKTSSIANLQIRMPVVVIGGGLTGVDAATEAQAYYLLQIEKIASRYSQLTEHHDEECVRSQFSKGDLVILDEFLQHAKELASRRRQAELDGVPLNTVALLQSWGGVTIAYRRSMQESPAYQRNHLELKSALEEGLYYAEGLQPKAVLLDDSGHVSALTCSVMIMDEEGRWMSTDDEQRLQAKSILVATGAKPNVAYAFEHQGELNREKFEYQRFEQIDSQLQRITQHSHVKSDEIGPFTSYERDHYRVSFLGDTHPVFHGSVVKAIASAKRIYPAIVDAVQPFIKTDSIADYNDFVADTLPLFKSKIKSIKRLNASAIELVIISPFAARNFKPGQLFRLQNYETDALMVGGTLLQMEALSLMAVPVPNAQDELRFIVIDKGVSSHIAATLTVGASVSLMGPTGVKTKIPEQPTTMLVIGGMLAIVYLMAIGPAMKAAGHTLIFICELDDAQQLYSRDDIERLADYIIWVVAKGKAISDGRPQDYSHVGQLADALKVFHAESDEHVNVLKAVTSAAVIGNAELLRHVQALRATVLQSMLSSQVKFTGSVYGPMQCMLKGICAQCLQWQIDPATGKRTKAVYACSWHHQPMDIIDIDNLDQRLEQNRVQETLSSLWLDHLLAFNEVDRI